jgi:hypothetical protein
MAATLHFRTGLPQRHASRLSILILGIGIEGRTTYALASPRTDVAGSAEQLIRVSGSGDLPIGRLLDVRRAVLPFVAPDEREKFFSGLLGRAFAEVDIDDPRISSLLEDAGIPLEPRQLIHLATSPGAPTQRVAANVGLLAYENILRPAIAGLLLMYAMPPCGWPYRP